MGINRRFTSHIFLWVGTWLLSAFCCTAFLGELTLWHPWVSLPIAGGFLALWHRDRWWKQWSLETCSRVFFGAILSWALSILLAGVLHHFALVHPFIANLVGLSVFCWLISTLPVRWQQHTHPATHGFGFSHLCWLLMTAGLSVPIWVTSIPPMADYPAHLARVHITQNIDKSNYLNQYFSVDGTLVPNLGFDVVMGVIVPLCGDIYSAGQWTLVFTIALFLYGALLFHQTLWDRWSTTPLFTGFVVYNACFTTGFISWSLSVGLAFCCASLWLKATRYPPLLRLAIGICFSGILYGCHVFGFIFYGIIIGGHAVTEVVHGFRTTRDRDPQKSGTGGNTLVLCILQAVFMMPIVLSFSKGGETLSESQWSGINHLLGLFFPFWSPLPAFSILLTLLMVFIVVFGWVSRTLRIHKYVALSLCSLGVFWLTVPTYFMETHFVSERFMVLFCVLILATWNWHVSVPRLAKHLCGSAALTVLATHIGIMAYQWSQFEPWGVELNTLSKQIDFGTRVHHALGAHKRHTVNTLFEQPFSVVPTRAMVSLTALAHSDSLLTIERDVFVPHHFTHPSKHMLKTQPEVNDIDIHQGIPLGVDQYLVLMESDAHIFQHPEFQPYHYLLISYPDRLSHVNQQRLEGHAIYKSQRFWLLENPDQQVH